MARRRCWGRVLAVWLLALAAGCRALDSATPTPADADDGGKKADAEAGPPMSEKELVAGEREFNKSIIELTDSSFFKMTKAGSVMVFIYAEGSRCPKSCRRAKVMWVALKKAGGLPEGMLMARLRGDTYKAHPAARHVKAFPTVVFVRKYNVIALYPGVFAVEPMKRWVKEMGALGEEEMLAWAGALEDVLAAARVEEAEAAQRAKEEEEEAIAAFMDLPLIAKTNFTAATVGRDAAIMYYKDLCPKSRLAKPKWVNLARRADKSLLVARSRVRGIHDGDVAGGVSLAEGVPALIYVRGGKVLGRAHDASTADDVVTWATKMAAVVLEEDKPPPPVEKKAESGGGESKWRRVGKNEKAERELAARLARAKKEAERQRKLEAKKAQRGVGGADKSEL